MSISNQTNKTYGAGNSVTTTFSFNFKVFNATEIYAYLINNSTGAVTGPLTSPTDYTISINPVTEGGTITFAVAPATGYTWFIIRRVPLTQSAVIPTEGTLPGSQLENQLDLAVMMNIQTAESVARTLQLQTTSLFAGPVYFEDPVDASILQYSLALGRYVNVLLDPSLSPLPSPSGHGLALLRANSGGTAYEFVTTLADSYLSQITTAGKVSGAAITSLTSVPSGAGLLPPLNGGVPSGAMMEWPAAVAPSGYLLCDGSAVSRVTYAGIFAVISTLFGAGDGSTTFNLPDRRERVAVGYKSGSTEFGTLGQTGGAKTVTLTSAESGLPAHTHQEQSLGGGTNIGWGVQGNAGSGDAVQEGYVYTKANAAANAASAHNNIQPYITLNVIIKI